MHLRAGDPRFVARNLAERRSSEHRFVVIVHGREDFVGFFERIARGIGVSEHLLDSPERVLFEAGAARVDGERNDGIDVTGSE